MKYYKITNVATNKCLNVQGDNVSSLKDNQNVTLWADSGSAEQKWGIENLQIGVSMYVMSSINIGFALNAYRSSSTKYNCDVYPWCGNANDALVKFENTTGGVRIKLANYSKYLTADNNGVDVYWADETKQTNQVWKYTEVSKPGPQNQTYETSNGLHIINVSGKNIKLINQSASGSAKTLAATNYSGINGSFFDMDGTNNLLTIAYQDGKCLGRSGVYGRQNRVGGCVIAWNGSNVCWHENIEWADDLLGTGSAYLKTGTWMQGGIGLWLGYSGWLTPYNAQDDGSANSYNDGTARPRTGLIGCLTGSNAGTVKLVVTNGSMTVPNFRAAIQGYLRLTDGASASRVYQALMLDGGISTQMAALNVLSKRVLETIPKFV